MIKREDYLQQIDAGFKYNPIVLLLGARQVGKTSIMEMYSKNKDCIWLNGENPEEMVLFTSFSLLENFLKVNLHPEIKGLLIIDEFQ